MWSTGQRPRLMVDELVPWSWPAGSGFAGLGAVVFGHWGMPVLRAALVKVWGARQKPRPVLAGSDDGDALGRR